ncbi:hypothetical protein BC831DRAFT_208988 [Entophlyctis helioformis]|nr:hypothetical protein BC831DRAFT_208988 [Entophlyctis helioformis]
MRLPKHRRGAKLRSSTLVLGGTDGGHSASGCMQQGGERLWLDVQFLDACVPACCPHASIQRLAGLKLERLLDGGCRQCSSRPSAALGRQPCKSHGWQQGPQQVTQFSTRGSSVNGRLEGYAGHGTAEWTAPARLAQCFIWADLSRSTLDASFLIE